MTQHQEQRARLVENEPVGMLQQFTDACRSINQDSARELAELYADDVYYEDSHQALQGKKAFLAYCLDFLGNRTARVRIITSIEDENSFFISWSATIPGKKSSSTAIRAEGASYFKTRRGLIYFQRNYFDIAEGKNKRSRARRSSWIRSKKSP